MALSDPNDSPTGNGLRQVTPALRRELRFRPQEFGGQACVVIEDPVGARFYRVGMSEYTFISLFNGRATVGEILKRTLEACPDCGFTAQDALAICQWATRSGLTQDISLEAAQLASLESALLSPRRSGRRWSPLSVQVPLIHPDRIFDKLQPWLGWCFTFPAFLVWFVVAVWALRDLAVDGTRLAESSSGVLASGNWLWLGVVWVVLKLIHETAHGIVCKRLGGDVREAGVIFILLAPLAYVDVTSSWRLQSKWARIQVAVAGMYVELFLAAVAALMWCRLEPGSLSQICLNVMTTASVMTIVFNANPLMRFDGYYIFSDFVEIPNLYAMGQQFVRYLVRRFLFGMRIELPQATGPRRWVICLYGVAAWVWRNLVFWSLVLTAVTLLHGAGVILSAVAILFWMGAMVRRLISFWRPHQSERPNWARFAVISSVGILLLLSAIIVIPRPGAVVAPAIVRYSHQSMVRTCSDGFVRQVRVEGGDRVQREQVLIVLEHDGLKHEVEELKLAVKKSRLQRRIYQRQHQLAKAQAEQEELRTLEAQYAEKAEELAHLVIRAPQSGKILGRNLSSLVGKYLPKGSDLLSIGVESVKEVRFAIAQEDVDKFRAAIDRPASIRLSGFELNARVSQIQPRASVLLIDPSLSAPNGGTLAVRDVAGNSRNSTGTVYELLEPRFTGIIRLPPTQSNHLFAGQRAQVAVRPQETVGTYLYRVATDWVDSKLRRKQYRSFSQALRGESHGIVAPSD